MSLNQITVLKKACSWCITSADRSICALIYENGNFDIWSTKLDKVIFKSDSIKSICEATKKRLNDCPPFDFSPNNQKFVIQLHDRLYISDISDNSDRTLIILPAVLENVYFVSDEILVCLADKRISVFDIKNCERITMESNIICDAWDNIALPKFLNRQNKTILGFHRAGRKYDKHTKSTLLLDFDGNVSQGPVFDGLKANMDIDFGKINRLIVVGSHYDNGSGDYDHNDNIILDFSDYALKGTVKEMKHDGNEKYWIVFGVPFIKVDIRYDRFSTYVAEKDCGDFMFETDDKVAGQDLNHETNKNELIIISKNDFVSCKLATVIGCSLVSGHETSLKKFSTHDAQKLFPAIWEFCRD